MNWWQAGGSRLRLCSLECQTRDGASAPKSTDEVSEWSAHVSRRRNDAHVAGREKWHGAPRIREEIDRSIYIIDPGNPPRTLAENKDCDQDYRAAVLHYNNVRKSEKKRRNTQEKKTDTVSFFLSMKVIPTMTAGDSNDVVLMPATVRDDRLG